MAKTNKIPPIKKVFSIFADMIFLENEHLKVSLTNKGAELRRLVFKKTGVDYLWNGNPDYWGKFSPILFPIVGALKNNTYYFEGSTYQLSRHGFARDHDFEVETVTATDVIFTLCDTEETLKSYPFQFKLRVRYTLNESSLSCVYEVFNPSQNCPLYFSIGAHPAFSVPLRSDLAYTDYFLSFNKDRVLSSHKISGDLINDETIDFKLEDGKLALTHGLFYEDALVFKGMESTCISIRSDKDLHGLDFKFKDFPFFGIWAAKNADFVCLEPWCGIADGVNHEQDLVKKEGIICLSAQKLWSRSWEITCF